MKIKFLGLGGLDVVHEELGDGAELAYDEAVGVAPDALSRLTPARGDLEAFRAITPTKGPDYRAGAVVAEAERIARRTPPK